MTQPDHTAALTGEQRLARKRRSFWRYYAALVGAGLLAGLFSGAAAAMVEDGTLPPAAIYAALAVLLALGAWFTRDYFRRVDELDVMDNLWASTIGLYCYFFIVASWTMLADAGLATEPEELIIAASVLVISSAAYLLRKAGIR